MAVSLKASRQGLELVDQARRKKGWTKMAAAWLQAAKISTSTLKRFWRGAPIQQETFIAICQAVELKNWEEIAEDSSDQQKTTVVEFYSYDSFWVGRERLVKELSEKIRGSCRFLIILGLTGIGKTSLAERVAVELQDWLKGDWTNRLRRANFDNEVKSNDFVSVAARWLEEWGEKVPPEDNKPERLLQKLVKHLRENQVLVLIDS